MKRLKNIIKPNLVLLFATVIFSALLTSCKEDSKPKLLMVTEATFPPYEYHQNGKIIGIDPEIIQEIARRIGYDLVIEDMSFDSIITAVQTGKADIAASGITVTEERKQRIAFTVPYVMSEQLIIVPEKTDIRKPADLKGKRIGVQHGSTSDLYVAKHFQNPQRFANAALGVAALVSGKLDAVVLDGGPAKVHSARNPGLKLLPEALVHEEYAFVLNKKDKELLTKINGALTAMKEEGLVDEIIRKYEAEMKRQEQEKKKEKQSFLNALGDSIEINFIRDKRYMFLVRGFLITLQISFFAVIMGIIIGFGVAIIRSTADQTGKLKFANTLCKIYLTVIRGTPVVVQLLIIYFVIFGSVDVDKVLVAIIAFGINSGAYVAEIIRSGIMSIDKGQLEAGRSLGLSYPQTMFYIILPQAFKNVLPALGNEFIVLLKETSVSGYIALQDLTKGGDIIRSQTYDAFLPLIAVALIYLAVVMLFTHLLGILEGKLKKNE
ncbi:MAG: ABC transporter substrate-binding protein/permease [Lentisphaeria bacterium]|nr:ABC transporter substrate-binding protein/permease [Lentisphaeria bacterium]